MRPQTSPPEETMKTGIEWNVDAIKSDGRDTGQVQIWADVDTQDAHWIKEAVTNYERLKEVARQVMADAGDCSCSDHKCLFCLAQESLTPEVR